MCVIDRHFSIRAPVTTAVGYQGFILNLGTSGASPGVLHSSHKQNTWWWCLSFHFVQFWSSFSLLYLMPLRESECDGKGYFFFNFFCIVSLKLINIPIEIVNFCQIFRYLGVTDKGIKLIPDLLPPVETWWNFAFPGLGDTVVSVSLFPSALWFAFTFAL